MPNEEKGPIILRAEVIAQKGQEKICPICGDLKEDDCKICENCRLIFEASGIRAVDSITGALYQIDKWHQANPDCELVWGPVLAQVEVTDDGYPGKSFYFHGNGRLTVGGSVTALVELVKDKATGALSVRSQIVDATVVKSNVRLIYGKKETGFRDYQTYILPFKYDWEGDHFVFLGFVPDVEASPMIDGLPVPKPEP